MHGALGVVMITVGLLSMFGIWLFTSYYFFATGQTFLGLLALLVPPADLVLPFLISWQLGAIGISGTVLAFAGFAVKGE